MTPTIIMLIVSLYFPGKPPTSHRVEMPDVKVCLQEAEEFLNHFESSEIAKGAIGVSAMCGRQFGEPVKEEKS